ncbi:MAG: PA0069 family radical SAM protein [Pseudotabrizicola sp.]|uniref:PA0069 family radical SAM protein n=1 Tax=Pseudotabrizicola sp. TaxID=2939647 RepID=UPI00272F0CD1|nr:PA0069 family radical SAM protein [Pseudotabrizicola sp.]MDP2082907.1 PA0069 family radical SAM protein [Pseudotabrizicola sp.]MDZ7574439.1 PA0069 family radical SAM protein [Pseudotabrizicola sp.]
MSETDATLLPGLRLRARGAASNAVGRFEAQRRARVDDGWEIAEDDRLLRTEVRIERPRSALSYNRSPDLPFDRSVNPYRGCEHGCVYCFARPSHAYLNLSPGLDFETRLIARPGIAEVLAGELRARRYGVATVALGTNTDPYQPCEVDHLLMRQVLQVLSDFNHPTAITTKGTLIERDIDILAPMAAKGLLRVGISVTTLEADLSRKLEPRAPAPLRRLAMIRRLSDAGIPVRVMLAPVIPGLTDPELEGILTACRDAGAQAASWIALRLPLEVSPLFQDWLAQHVPGRAAKVMARVREMHGGKDYDAHWGRRMRGEGVWANLIAQRFDKAVARLGLVKQMPPLRADLFRPPPRAGDQLALF